MSEIDVLEALSDGVVSILVDGRKALWTLRTLRRDTRCAVTKVELLKGEKHYGPVTNADFRMLRLHRSYVETQT